MSQQISVKFTELPHAELLLIECPTIIDKGACDQFRSNSKSWLLQPKEKVIFDFKLSRSICHDFYREILQFSLLLKKDQKVVQSVNLDAILRKQIQADGVEAAFSPIESLEKTTHQTRGDASPRNSSGLSVAFVNPFLKAVHKTIEVQCLTQVTVQKPYVKTKEAENIVLAGVLSLLSDGANGSVVICFTEKVFLGIYENMFGEKHTQILPEMEDAAGELLNIIYGIAKVELNSNGYSFQRALPTVLSGEKLRIRQKNERAVMVIPFETQIGFFYLEVDFEKIRS